MDQRRLLSIGLNVILVALLAHACASNKPSGELPIPRPDDTLPGSSQQETKTAGPLQFSAASFESTATNTFTSDGIVQVGFKPASGSSFLPLIQLKGGVKLTTGDDPQFSTSGEIDAVISGSDAIPLLDGSFSADINQLLNDGVKAANGKPITINGVSFKLDTLLLADPASGPEIKLQGEINVAELDSITIDVKDSNFVIIDKAGVQLSGLKATVSPKDSFTIAKVKFKPKSLSFEYQKANSLYEITGDAQAIVDGDTIAIELGAGKTPGLAIKNGSVEDFDITISQDSTFSLKQVSVKPKFLELEYQAAGPLYEMYGDAYITVEKNTFHVTVGDTSKKIPGLEIKDGKLASLDFTVTEDSTFKLNGLTIDPKDLSFQYHQDSKGNNIYDMSGDLSIATTTESIEVALGDSSKKIPGLVIGNGKIDTLLISFTDSLTLGGIQFDTKDLSLEYTADSSTYVIQGSASIPEIFDATVSFPGKGITIDGDTGQWELDGIGFKIKNANLGAFEINEFAATYEKDGDSFDLTDTLNLSFPGGFDVGGSIDFKDGRLNELAVTLEDSLTPIPLGDTGLFLYLIGASADNLTNPGNLIVSGKIGVEFGEEEPLVTLDGSFTVDKHELILDAIVKFLGGLEGEGSAKLDLDWGAGRYSIDADWGLFDCSPCIFNFELGFSIDKSLDITMFGEADVRVPHQLPIIGGKELAAIDFYFQRRNNIPSEDFAAAWLTVDLFIWHPEVGLKYAFNPDSISFLGASAISNIQQSESDPQTQLNTYSGTVNLDKDNVTHLSFHANWPVSSASSSQTISVEIALPSDTVSVDSADFSVTENGIQFVETLSSDTSLTIMIVHPDTDTSSFVPLSTGQYTIQFITDQSMPGDSLAYVTHFGIPKPKLTLHSVSAPEGSATATVNYTPESSSHADSVQVEFYLDWDSTGYDGIRVAGDNFNSAALAGAEEANSADFDISNLLPLEYYVYGVIKDEVNVPVKSGYSDAFTPKPPVWGGVNDLQGDAILAAQLGLTLEDSGDTTYATTDTSGAYSFYPTDPGTYTLFLIAPPGYLAPKSLQTEIDTVIQIVTDDQKNINFTLLELASISGTAYDDINQNGVQDNNEPGVPQQMVYMKNSAGKTDSTVTSNQGKYTFYSVPKGSYQVNIKVLDDWYYVIPDSAQFTAKIVSDTINATHISANFPLIYKYTAVSGVVYHNIDGSAARDSNDTDLAGWAVALIEAGADADTVAFDTTDNNGIFLFPRVTEGSYTVAPLLQPGWQQVAATADSITAQQDTFISTMAFGYAPAFSATLAGNCFGNAPFPDYWFRATTDEAGLIGPNTLFGWSPTITISTSLSSLSEATQGNGLQIMRSIASVNDEPIVVQTFSTVDLASVSSISWSDEATPQGPGIEWCCSPANCQIVSQPVFGPDSVELASLAGTVFYDENSNGILDPGDKSLEGWTVTLSGDSSASDTSGNSGQFLFPLLKPGSYTLSPVIQAGWMSTANPLSDSSLAETLAADAFVSGINFGYAPAISFQLSSGKCPGENPGTTYWLRAASPGAGLIGPQMLSADWSPTLTITLADSATQFKDLQAATRGNNLEVWRQVASVDTAPQLLTTIPVASLAGKTSLQWADNALPPRGAGITWCCQAENCQPTAEF